MNNTHKAGTPPTPHKQGTHGGLRGLNSALNSNTTQGRFGRMFRTLPKAWWSDEALTKLSKEMVADLEAVQTPDSKVDGEENTGISAGYTYLGQFIDHDITFDPASSLQKQNDPDSLVDFRSPKFDLDNIYGRGPQDQPYLYAADGKRLLLGEKLTGSEFDKNTQDLLRTNSKKAPRRAIIGDPRNDENVIVSQLQSIFIRFHNRLVDLQPEESFLQIQQMVRWHYQWVVLNDFLATIINEKTYHQLLPHIAKKTNVAIDKPNIHDVYNWDIEPYIPVEFSVAAYRFGHSMIRPVYRLNTTLPTTGDNEGRFLIFAKDPSLRGFREFPRNWAIDWRLFFEFGNKKTSPKKFDRVQPAYKIDTSLVGPLKHLPGSVSSDHPNLAFLNLFRGRSMGLPSGQAVARYMGLKPLADKDILIGKAAEDDVKNWIPLSKIDPSFTNNAPLWTYILAESKSQFKNDKTPIRLGEVGGRIVGSVFIGLLMGDSFSYLSQDPTWTPEKSFMKNGKFGITELISQAIQAKVVED